MKHILDSLAYHLHISLGASKRLELWLVATLVLLGMILGSPVVSWSALQPQIRVLLAQDVASLRVSSFRGFTVKDASATTLKHCANSVTLLASQSQVVVGGLSLGSEVWLVPKSGVFRWGAHSYRGFARVMAGPNGLTLVNSLPLEPYLKGVLGGEIPASWPSATQEALAVAARTYALYQIERQTEDNGTARDERFDVYASVKDQVYLGLDGESSASYKAVAATSGLVLSLDQMHPIKAYYSAWCGGATSDSWLVFGSIVPKLVGVKCSWCHGEPWETSFSWQQLKQAVCPAAERLGDIRVLGYDSSGRIDQVQLTEVNGEQYLVSGHSLRMRLGASRLRSTKAQVHTSRQSSNATSYVTFSGRGWGHGVGLCQRGSLAMGQAGYDFAGILQHYYPECKLCVWY